MKIVAILFSISLLNACSAESQADEVGASCESVYVGDGDRVKRCEMPSGDVCYMIAGSGISCLRP